MGNHSSKTKGDGANNNNNGVVIASSHEDQAAACPPCFFLGDGLSKVLRRAVSSSDPIGSPLPETPDFTRKKRREVQAALRNNNNNNNNNSRNNGELCDATIFSSKYIGLEKEVVDEIRKFEKETSSSRLLLRPQQQQQHQQHQQRQAPIYEGPTAERELQDRYQVMEVLGVGSTSTVHRCVQRQSGKEYACKIIDCVVIEERFEGMMDQFHREIEVLRDLKHPAIVRLYDVFITSCKIYIVMELMQGGELFDYVVQKGTLTEQEAAGIVRMVCSAVVYMHEKNIVHRDLKPENLLLKQKTEPNEKVEVKIIDFGLCKAMEEPVARTFLGTRGYLAPEMLQRQQYTKAVDTWALGVIVFVLLCGCLPFDDDSSALASEDLVRAKFVLRFPRWAKNLSESSKHLLKHLLDINPATRYTAEQAYDHPWTQGRTADDKTVLLSPARIRKSPAFTAGKKTKYAGKGALISPANSRNKKPTTVAAASPSDSGSEAAPVLSKAVRKKSI